MARRSVNPSRRLGSVPLVGSLHHKSRASPLLYVGLMLLAAILLVLYSYSGSGGFGANKEAYSSNGGYPGQQRAKVSELSKFGRPAKLRSSSWWIRYFVQTSLHENEDPMRAFEQAVSQSSYTPSCQIFHLSLNR